MSLQAWSASEWRSIVAEVLSLTSDPAATSAQLDDAHQNLVTAGMPQTRPENLSQAELQEIVALRQTALEALAAHPNLSAPTLAKLVRETPEGFCRNPVASLFFVEYPALLAEFDIPTLRRVLRCAEAPMALLLSLVESDRLPEIAAEAALHVSVRGEIPAERWREEVIAYLCSIAKAASAAQTESPQTFCRIAARMHPGIDRGSCCGDGDRSTGRSAWRPRSIRRRRIARRCSRRSAKTVTRWSEQRRRARGAVNTSRQRTSLQESIPFTGKRKYYERNTASRPAGGGMAKRDTPGISDDPSRRHRL